LEHWRYLETRNQCRGQTCVVTHLYYILAL
jgi:hypothetical protein